MNSLMLLQLTRPLPCQMTVSQEVIFSILKMHLKVLFLVVLFSIFLLLHHQIVTLKHKGRSLGRRTPPQYARAIVSMPNLQNLELNDVDVSDNFYSQMAEGASHSKVYHTYIIHFASCAVDGSLSALSILLFIQGLKNNIIGVGEGVCLCFVVTVIRRRCFSPIWHAKKSKDEKLSQTWT